MPLGESRTSMTVAASRGGVPIAGSVVAVTLSPMVSEAAPAPRQSWRDRLLPRSVLGLSMFILAGAIGAAFSGTVLYAYYDYRLNKNEERVSKFVAGFDKTFQKATDAIAAQREDAKNQIKKELEPLQKVAVEGSTLEALERKVRDSLWFVKTLDEAGQPSVGTAFVVASDSNQTFLLTSYTTVRAATRQPGPDVTVSHSNQDEKATLWTWQEEKDLALLILQHGSTPRLPWTNDSPAAKTGDRVFAVSGLGAAGGAIVQGLVADVSSAGIQHDVPIGPSFQGAPILNSKGEVLAIASRTYAPLGFAGDAVFFGVPIRDSCSKVLKCPSGDVNAPGERR